jgi:hypothetical protein
MSLLGNIPVSQSRYLVKTGIRKLKAIDHMTEQGMQVRAVLIIAEDVWRVFPHL